MDKKIKGIIITSKDKALSEEDILIYILKVTDIKNILNIDIESDYFKKTNIVGEYNVKINKENDSFSLLVIVNDNNEIKHNLNYDLLFSLIVFVMIISLIIVLFIQKINLKIKKKKFYKSEIGE